jgi:acetyl esterase/lipase
VLCGNSAGGDLLLGAAQDSRLPSKILGVVSIYPVVEFGSNSDTKMATRPDPSVPDFIRKRWDNIQKLYVDEAQKPFIEDVRLGPRFFSTRVGLPSEVLLIGVEHDMFCCELEVMADKFAGDKTKVSCKKVRKRRG